MRSYPSGVMLQLTNGARLGVTLWAQRPASSVLVTGGSVSDETPVLDALEDMTRGSVEHNSLSPREYMLARLAALIAVDAPPASYFANASALKESGMTTEDIQAIMIAVAPVVGAPRVVAAGGHILRALGIAVAVADAEMAGEGSQL
jgi:alkylhydroperoxidase/carboxymuconolactone decarboxylase family protein YurZ